VLVELVTARSTPTPNEGLFPCLNGRGIAQATVPVEIRLNGPRIAVLDDLVEQTGIDSRTQLITAAFRYHLG
jgi:hypothetical protein